MAVSSDFVIESRRCLVRAMVGSLEAQRASVMQPRVARGTSATLGKDRKGIHPQRGCVRNRTMIDGTRSGFTHPTRRTQGSLRYAPATLGCMTQARRAWCGARSMMVRSHWMAVPHSSFVIDSSFPGRLQRSLLRHLARQQRIHRWQHEQSRDRRKCEAADRCNSER